MKELSVALPNSQSESGSLRPYRGSNWLLGIQLLCNGGPQEGHPGTLGGEHSGSRQAGAVLAGGSAGAEGGRRQGGRQLCNSPAPLIPTATWRVVTSWKWREWMVTLETNSGV